jgi:isochorismate synthase
VKFMDTTFTNSTSSADLPVLPDISEVIRFQFLACDRDALRETLRRAIAQANHLGSSVLTSFLQPVATDDPLHFFLAFQALRIGNNTFWARPAEQRALVGTGATTTIKTVGPGYVAAAADRWQELQQQMITGRGEGTLPTVINGPVLFGGFAFDPLYLRTRLWRIFPDSLLVLPRLLFACEENSAALGINIRVSPSADVVELERLILRDLLRLDSALGQTTEMPSDQPYPTSQFTMEDQISPSTWKQMVIEAVQRIRQQEFQKVVLARSMSVTSEKPFEIPGILQRLRESYPGAYVFAIQRGGRYFVGATPERLLRGTEGRLETMALAGSAPRGKTEDEDRQFGEELLHSSKNREEHQFVVSTICNALTDLCSQVWLDNEPRLLKLKNIQHLETPIKGILQPGRSILEAIEYLHPTPAVGGVPRRPALEEIRQHEQLDRGWYAGPIGWVGCQGNGEFAVALRSALVDGNQATLFAGCGIVADSQPESEYAESCLKLQVMLRGLGCEV